MMRATTKQISKILLGLGAILMLSCSEPFDSFNEVEKLRIMGIKAEPPTVFTGENANLTALVYEPTGKPISYEWSWCPLSTGGINGFECAVDEDELKTLIESAVPGASLLLPSFDLGTDPTAVFEYAMPPELLTGLCNLTASQLIPEFTVAPTCEDSLDITITLRVTAGEEEVIAVKEVSLALDPDLIPNGNPMLGNIHVTNDDGAQVLMDPDTATTLKEKTQYDFFVKVPNSASEEFVRLASEEEPNPEPEKENLFMTWFVTGGNTDAKRTTFIEGTASLKDLGTNAWTTPAIETENNGRAILFLVLQDQRGGVEWTSRNITLEEL